MMLVPVTYRGGVYRHNEIMDLIDDVGGYIVQKHVIASDVVLLCFMPKDDVDVLRAAAKPLGGEVIDSPLVGTEIAVVSMSLEIHHLPHPSCDIAEYLRRLGGKTNMVSLARGPGKRIAGLETRTVASPLGTLTYMYNMNESTVKAVVRPTASLGVSSIEDLTYARTVKPDAVFELGPYDWVVLKLK
jgi:hypothetical protein